MDPPHTLQLPVAGRGDRPLTSRSWPFDITWSVAPLGSLMAGSLASLTSTAVAVGLGGFMVVLFTQLAFVISPEIRNLRRIVPEYGAAEEAMALS